jgi:hypothetical protein
MRKVFEILLLGAILTLLFSSSGNAQSLEGKVIEHRLENGLTLLLYERHQAPIVSCHLYIDVGSANDKLGQTGIAHMTEHIAFKGMHSKALQPSVPPIMQRKKSCLNSLTPCGTKLRRNATRGKRRIRRNWLNGNRNLSAYRKKPGNM